MLDISRILPLTYELGHLQDGNISKGARKCAIADESCYSESGEVEWQQSDEDAQYGLSPSRGTCRPRLIVVVRGFGRNDGIFVFFALLHSGFFVYQDTRVLWSFCGRRHGERKKE